MLLHSLLQQLDPDSQVPVRWVLARLSAENPLERGGDERSETLIGEQRPAAPLLTADELAQALRISKNRVYELARRGELKHVRIGRRVRFPATLELLAPPKTH